MVYDTDVEQLFHISILVNRPEVFKNILIVTPVFSLFTPFTLCSSPRKSKPRKSVQISLQEVQKLHGRVNKYREQQTNHTSL